MKILGIDAVQAGRFVAIRILAVRQGNPINAAPALRPNRNWEPVVAATAGILAWWLGMSLMDHLTQYLSKSFAANLRVSLWLQLVEILWKVWRKHTAGSMICDSSARAGNEAAIVRVLISVRQILLSMVVRVPLSLMATALFMVWCGESVAVRIAGLIPSLVLAIVPTQSEPERTAPPPSKGRGTHLGNDSDAQRRAAQLIEMLEAQVGKEN